MSNEEIFIELQDTLIKDLIKMEIENKGFESIKDINVFHENVKAKWFFIPYKKKIKVVEFIVDEGLLVVESLLSDLSLNQLVDKYFTECKLKIIYT